MAPKKSAKKETKSDYLRKVLGKNPNLEPDQINQGWTKSGHAGTISNALYYHVRAELGIKSEWGWYPASEPAVKWVSPTSAGGAKSPASRSGKVVGEVYQLKLTLLNVKPPIWRRIQVADCTLDRLHEHIQTAMGWTNSHMHHFIINGKYYGDPMLVGPSLDDDPRYTDSTTTMLSAILPANGQPFRFGYEYDFGDSWEHEILFEGRLPAEPRKQYPLCLEGARACPPEDVGGIWGYADFLEAIGDPHHENHKEMKSWIGGRFDPEAFSPATATRRMKQGLPDWRSMR